LSINQSITSHLHSAVMSQASESEAQSL